MSRKHVIYGLLLILVTSFTVYFMQNERQSFVASTSLSCLDEDGTPIDWFIAYKFPQIHEATNENLKSGYAYGYIMADPNTKENRQLKLNTTRDHEVHRFPFSVIFPRLLAPLRDIHDINYRQTVQNNLTRSPRNEKNNHKYHNNDWTLSDKLIKDDESLIFRTLKPAFDKSVRQADSSINLIFYNDQPPSGGPSSNDDYAHSKGTVLMDTKSKLGIWLTHSTPRFPPQHLNDLKFEKNAAVNGQTFMCVTFDLAKSGDKIANHLITMKPQIYDSQLSEKLLNMIPEFRELKLGRSRDTTRRRSNKLTGRANNDHIHQTIETLGGQRLNLFAKSKSFQRDLYADWLVNELDSDLFVETWRNGGGSPLNSTCPLHAHKVNNVKDLKIDINSSEIDWHYTHDHSKWAISQREDSAHVCIGDINRMHSQFKRGGGIVCLESEKSWNIFRNTIREIESC